MYLVDWYNKQELINIYQKYKVKIIIDETLVNFNINVYISNKWIESDIYSQYNKIIRNIDT